MNNPFQLAADRLWNAASSGKTCEPVRDLLAAAPDPLAAAHDVQRTNAARAVAAGRRVVGRKIGLTSVAVQRQPGVGEPDFGTLFAETAAGDAEEISLDGSAGACGYHRQIGRSDCHSR